MTFFQTKNTNRIQQKTSLMAVVLFFIMLSSCSGDRTGISKMVVGEKDAAEAFIGLPLLVKAEIALEENIASIDLHMATANTGDWTFTQHFTEKYSGSNTASFDEQFMFPNGTEAGNYELTLVVTGESGAVVERKRNFRISVDSTVPVVEELEVGINASGDDLHLAAHITAAKKIRQVILSVEGPDWSREFVFDKARIKDQMSVHFHEHAHVDEAPAGQYVVILTVEDQDGRKAAATGSFEKK